MTTFSGKFFAAFMSKYMPWDSTSSTVSETFRLVEAGLRNEFPFGPVVRMADAQAGHEEELVRLVTLLMYLVVVNHRIPSLASTRHPLVQQALQQESPAQIQVYPPGQLFPLAIIFSNYFIEQYRL